MLFEKIQLTEDNDVYLEAYVSEKVGNFVRDTILVIPGGGYGGVCTDREGEPIAQAFVPFGFNAFVLHYSVGRKRSYPSQLVEASLAIKHIKDNADKYNINKDRIFILGFSAGGHLAGSLGTMWHRKEIYDAIPNMDFGYNKPCGMMLIYPVLNNHKGSFQNLLCKDNLSQADISKVDVVKAVDKNTVPAFIMHTFNDEIVPVSNSLDMAAALNKIGVTFEMHIFPDAPHGVALCNEITKTWDDQRLVNPVMAKWVEFAATWSKTIK